MFPIRLDRTFVIAIGIAALVFFLHIFQIVDFHELEAVDLRFRLRGPQTADPRITVVTIDDRSIKALGQWPWPRGIHASFLDIISRQHPAAIFVDMLFTEQSPDPAEDQKLRKSLAEAGNVTLAFYYLSEAPFEANLPIAPLMETAAGVGFVNAPPDHDGRLRRVRAFIKTDRGVFFHPSIMLALRLMENKTASDPWLKRLPLDRDHNLWINFPGDHNAYQRVSFGEVIRAAGLNQEELLKKLFSETLVVIGNTATGTSDLKPTPFSTYEPGVFLHAAALHTLLSGKTLQSVSPAVHFLFLLLLCGLSAWGAQKMSPLHGLILSLGLAGVYELFNFLSFVFLGWIFPFFVPLTAIASSYAATLFMKYLEVRMQKEMMVREMEAASEIQQKFLPQSLPPASSLDVAFECRFCKQVGGDLYDWVDLGNNRLGFCIGDVSGKGMPAAIYMAKALNDFRSIDKNALQPGEVCQALNQRLMSQEQSHMFLTFLYLVIDLSKGKILYSSAGHEPIVFFRKKTGETVMVKDAQGTPLGAFEGMPYETAELPFEKGDAFVLISDGVKELRNPRGQEFGLERVRQAVQEQAEAAKSAKDLVGSIFKILQKHQDDALPHDDRTLLCVVRV